MESPKPNSPELLREEILADARRVSEEIIHRAREEAAALLAKSAAEADKIRQARLDQARAEAARRKELILATVPVEAGRLRSARTETSLESIRDEVRRRLSARVGFDYREAVVTLAADAIRQMPGSAFVVRLSAADRALFGDEMSEAIAYRVGRALNLSISNDPALKESGPIIEDAQGRQMWDNRLLARLERFWPELRRQIAVQTGLVADGGMTGGAI